MTYDIEMLLSDIKSVLLANLNTKITALNSEKNDSISLTAIDSTAYALQSLNGANINFDPFIFYAVQDVKSVGQAGATSMIVDVVVAVVKEDQGMDLDIANRMFRYGRALKEVFEENFDQNAGAVKLTIQSLVPVEFMLMNSSFNHRAIGVLIQAEIG